MIFSLLDTDFYKLTLMQLIWQQFPQASAQYTFQCRNPQIKLGFIVPLLSEHVHDFLRLTFQKEEIQYLRTLQIFTESFLQHLETFTFSSTKISLLEIDDRLALSIEGSWAESTLLEVPLLAMINQLYYEKSLPSHIDPLSEARKRLEEKVHFLHKQSAPIYFIDFGTRRRFTHLWHMEIDQTLQKEVPSLFLGTSNLYSAWQHNLAPKGTMAHELFQAAQVLAPTQSDFQPFTLQLWKKIFPTTPAFALTDTLGVQAFLYDFSSELAQQYDGVRHDSGSPFVFFDLMLQHYEQLGIDAKQKTLLFSDHITFPLAAKITTYARKRARVAFGIGTHLTNDTGHAPLEIVIKLTKLNHQPVAKLSDSPEKEICPDQGFLEKIRGIKEEKEREYRRLKSDQS